MPGSQHSRAAGGCAQLPARPPGRAQGGQGRPVGGGSGTEQVERLRAALRLTPAESHRRGRVADVLISREKGSHGKSPHPPRIDQLLFHPFSFLSCFGFAWEVGWRPVGGRLPEKLWKTGEGTSGMLAQAPAPRPPLSAACGCFGWEHRKFGVVAPT